MSSRSTIALERADGSCLAICCSTLGDLKHNGIMLYRYYSTPSSLMPLFEKGDLLVLHPRADQCEFVKRVCNLPHSWYGTKEYASMAEHRKHINYIVYEYNYILRNTGTWEVLYHYIHDGPLQVMLEREGISTMPS